ncbi:hypothetical protein ACHWQZ_G004440 [Mnemiopsis leidyi]
MMNFTGYGFINPFQMNLQASSIICIPSYVSLILFSSTILYITRHHFLKLSDLYLSVLFYLLSQLLLLVVITSSWLLETIIPGETEGRCRIKLGFQTFTAILPGYCILIISVVRSVFVTLPLSYMDYLRKRNQAGGLVLAGVVAGVVAGLPSLGLCGVRVRYTLSPAGRYQYCSYGDLDEMSCKVYGGVLLGPGFFVPLVTTLVLYLYIYHIALKARKSHRRLTETGSTSSSYLDSKDRSRDSTSSERTTVPWSIIAVVLIAMATTLPWGFILLYSVEIRETLAQSDCLSAVFDLFYSVLQILIGMSPLAYILTTNSIRIVFVGLVKRWLCGRCLKETRC